VGVLCVCFVCVFVSVHVCCVLCVVGVCVCVCVVGGRTLMLLQDYLWFCNLINPLKCRNFVTLQVTLKFLSHIHAAYQLMA
jgi:hypothetical protein